MTIEQKKEKSTLPTWGDAVDEYVNLLVQTENLKEVTSPDQEKAIATIDNELHKLLNVSSKSKNYFLKLETFGLCICWENDKFQNKKRPPSEYVKFIRTFDPGWLRKAILKAPWLQDDHITQTIFSLCRRYILDTNKWMRESKNSYAALSDVPTRRWFLGKLLQTASLPSKTSRSDMKKLKRRCEQIIKAIIPKDKGGRYKKAPLPYELKNEYNFLCMELEDYLKQKYPPFVEERKIGEKTYLKIKKLDMLKNALNNFPPIKNKALPNISNVIDQCVNHNKKRTQINTANDLVKHILAKKHSVTFSRIERELTKQNPSQ